MPQSRNRGNLGYGNQIISRRDAEDAEKDEEMSRRFICIAVGIGGLFVGCSNQTTPSKSLPSTAKAESTIRAPESFSGSRSKQIGDARFYSVEDYISLRDNQKLAVGEFVCVEGRVKHAGERMGAAYFVFEVPLDDFVFSCEGEALRRYHIRPGMNVIVRGRIFDRKFGFLADASILTQSDIEEALGAEKE